MLRAGGGDEPAARRVRPGHPGQLPRLLPGRPVRGARSWPASTGARPACWGDIIEINSKSGLVGSSRNSAYAGSKFGGIGLTQSFALELVGDGIKVNAICPGNFFDGPLWSDPENGLFVQYLREGKVPGADHDRRRPPVLRGQGADGPRLHARPTCWRRSTTWSRQQYETGQALPVTGGQVMLS